MRPPPPKNVTRNLNVGCGGILWILIGAGFIGVPLQDGIPLGLFHGSYQTVSFLLFELVGIALVVGGIRAIISSRAFGQPKVEVPPRIEAGSTFPFHFDGPVRRRMTIRSIEAFFVYRENVEETDRDGSARYLFDRLIARQSFPGRDMRKGEKITLDCTFSAPAGEMGVRNPYMHWKDMKVVCLWVVRVRIQYGKSSEIWEDYQVEIAPQAGVSPGPGENAPQTELFDVLLLPSLVENTTSIRQVLKEIAPQLEQSGIPYVQHSVPNLIRERIVKDEAEALAKRLQGAGGIVSVIPTKSTWRIPTENGQAQTGYTPNLSP